MKKKNWFVLLTGVLISVCVLVSSGNAKQWKLRSADVVELASPYTIGMNKFADMVKDCLLYTSDAADE